MNIKEEIENLKDLRGEVTASIADNQTKLKKLNATIKQLEKLSGKATELIEDSPIFEDEKK